MPKDNNWEIKLEAPFAGYAELYWEDSYPMFGNGNQAGAMNEVDIINPNWLTQGPGLAALTAGTQAGAVDELIKGILDRAVADDASYAISATKLHQITSTSVTNAGDFPHTITGATDGQSVINFQGNLYYFYNKSSGGDIGQYDLVSTFDDDWGSTNDVALEDAPHPVIEAANLMVFGNGRYVGTYDGTTLDVQALDFKVGSVTVDIAYTNQRYYVAVNWPDLSGSNRNTGTIYVWDGTSTSWEGAIRVGGRIGAIWTDDMGIIYCVYRDPANGINKVGYVNGKSLVAIPASQWSGELPLFYQKTPYYNMMLFVSSGKVKAFGAQTNSLEAKVFDYADGGYATVGGLAAPFGTPLVASSDGASNQQLAKFSGYSTASTWKSLMFHPVLPGYVSMVDTIEVHTNLMSTGARVDLTLDLNQGASTYPSSGAWQIAYSASNNQTRHVREVEQELEDFRVALDWSNGSATNPAKIKKIFIKGHYVEKS